MADAPAPTSAATPANGAPPAGTAPAAKGPEAGTTVPTTAPKPNGKAAAPKTPEAAKPATEKSEEDDGLDIVVRGEKKRLTRAEAIRRLQIDEGGTKRFEEAKEASRKTQQLLSQLTDNTEETLTGAGVDVVAFAKKVLGQRISSEMEKQLPAEERQVLEEKRELEKLRTEAKKREEADAKSQQLAADEVVFQRLEKGFIEAAKRNGLEGTPEQLERIIGISSEWLDLGFPFNEDHVMQELKEREDASFAQLEAKVTKGLKGEALAKRLGPAVVEEILRWSIEKLRGGGAPAAAKAPAETKTPEAKPSSYMTDGEHRKKFGF